MDFQTKPEICHHMVKMLPVGVLTVLEPTPGEGNLVRALEGAGYQVTAPDNFWDIEGRWDAIVMNPPFSPMSVGYRILDRCMELSDVIIALMPWLTIINSTKRATQLENFGLRSVTHLPRNAFPGSRVQTCIFDLRRDVYDWDGRTTFYLY